MLGALTGDIIGSFRENLRTKRKTFTLFHPLCHFTDDTVLTLALADAMLKEKPLAQTFWQYALREPLRGYGPRFLLWMLIPGDEPGNSFGNGSAMRVSSVAYVCKTLESVLETAAETAKVTHSHPEGIKGAQAVAYALFAARTGMGKEDIRKGISERFGYDLNRTVDQIRPRYRFNMTCQGSVPEALIAFLDSSDFEDAIRNAVSLGGDADTQAAIAGSIAEAYYGKVPDALARETWKRLPSRYRKLIKAFHRAYPLPTDVSALPD